MELNTEKNVKVRTSITIDPRLLSRMREVVKAPDSKYRSVSQLIEQSVMLEIGDQNP